MATKARPAKVKAGEDQGLDLGEFEAIVSVFGNTDSVGDKVVPGAFEKSLADWAERDKPIPVIFTHSHNNAFDYIGDVVEAKETQDGLWVKGKLDIDPESENPTARQVYRLLKGGRIDNWSFAYDVVDEAPAEDGTNELKQLKLYEVGPTLIGANQETRTLAVKSAAQPDDTKAGRTLSASNEQMIRDAISALESVLASLGEAPKEGHAQHAAPAKDEEPERAKSEEPNPTGAADDLLTVIAIHEQEI